MGVKTKRRQGVYLVAQCGAICMAGAMLSAFLVWSARADGAITANPNITDGPGYTDVSPHQIVRTSGNVLYTIAPTCDAVFPCISGPNQNTLRVFGANSAGVPSGFSERDASDRPAGQIASSAIAVDGQDRIHVVYSDQSGAGSMIYRTFDSATGHWNPPAVLDAATNTHFTQGDEGVALALDAAGAPHVVWSSARGNGPVRLYYADYTGGTWSAPITIDDGAVPTGNFRSLHPAVAFTADNAFVVTWLRGTFDYVPDGTIYIRSRSASATWSATTAIPDQAMTTIDNGPSLLITPDGTQHVTFVAASPPDQVRYWYNAGNGWQGDQQPPAQVTHDPSLGPDGAGGISLYGHGTPVPYNGHGENLYRFHKPPGGSWGAWTLYTSGSYDSSVTTRWSQFFQRFPEIVDIAYSSDTYPNTVIHVGSEITAGGGSAVLPLPAQHLAAATLAISPRPQAPLHPAGPPAFIANSATGTPRPQPARHERGPRSSRHG